MPENKRKKTRWEKGESGNPNGRPKGSPNKFTASVKQVFGDAFNQLGGVQALTDWAKENPTDFYKLYSKLIPVDLTSNGESIISKVIVEVIDGTKDA